MYAVVIPLPLPNSSIRFTIRLYSGRYDLCFRPIVDDDVVAIQVYARLLFRWH